MNKTALNVNQCTTASQLTVLPGIGEKFAVVILNEKSIRPFQSTDDLVSRVKGLTKKKMSKIKRKFVLKFDITDEPDAADESECSPPPLYRQPNVTKIMEKAIADSTQMHNQQAVDKATMFSYLTNLMEYKIVSEPETAAECSPSPWYQQPNATETTKVASSNPDQLHDQRDVDKATMLSFLTRLMEYKIVSEQ